MAIQISVYKQESLFFTIKYYIMDSFFENFGVPRSKFEIVYSSSLVNYSFSVIKMIIIKIITLKNGFTKI